MSSSPAARRLSLRLLLSVAAVTRRLQAWRPRRPLRGVQRLARWMEGRGLHYAGTVRLPGGIRTHIDSDMGAERTLLFFGVYQPALAHALRQHTPPGGHCLDVGANIGYFTLHLARLVGSAGRVAAFEPDPALAGRIRRNVALNGFRQVAVIEKAVDGRSGQATFYVAAQPGKSSLVAAMVAQPLQRLVVETVTLDDFLRERGWPRLDVIKIDVEGNDCRVLLGGREALARFRPFVAFEYHYGTAPEVAGAAAELLGGLGYALWGLRLNGERFPFAWEAGGPLDHVDVLAWPG